MLQHWELKNIDLCQFQASYDVLCNLWNRKLVQENFDELIGNSQQTLSEINKKSKGVLKGLAFKLGI